MSKYFEALVLGGESIVIDDTLNNLEVCGEWPLSALVKARDSGGNIFYRLPGHQDKNWLFGIGLSEHAGQEFCPEFKRLHDGEIILEFYDPKSSIHNIKVARDDVVAKGKIYALSFGTRAPSPHGTGIEIYNSGGQVVFSSAQKHLNVLACDCVDPVTVSFGQAGVAFMLGKDISYDFWASDRLGQVGAKRTIYPQFTITGNNSVTVKKIIRTQVWAGDLEEIKRDLWSEHYYGAGFSYGWLIGEVI